MTNKTIEINGKEKEFRVIPGIKNYLVSKDGDLYSEFTSRLKNPNKNTGAFQYPSIPISVNGKSTTYPIHKLVALAWIPLPEDYTYDEVLNSFSKRPLVVDHIDGNKNNYHADNLRWATSLQNSNFDNFDRARMCEKLKGNQNAKNKKNPDSVPRYDYYYKNKKYKINELCKELKCSKSKITESFRRNLGLVRLGELRRIPINKIKEDENFILTDEEIVKLKKVFIPRELTEEEITMLNEIFKEEK